MLKSVMASYEAKQIVSIEEWHIKIDYGEVNILFSKYLNGREPIRSFGYLHPNI